MTRQLRSSIVGLAALIVFSGASVSTALTTSFTYQGRLAAGGMTANGACDFQFALFDDPSAGTQLSTTQAVTTAVAAGVFTAELDFGAAAFTGADRWLQIAVRCPTGSGNFVSLMPRQLLTPAPYALFAPIVARDPSGNPRASVDVLQTGDGIISTFGPNGNTNVLISSTASNHNHGFIGVADENGNPRAHMLVLDSGEGLIQTFGPNGNGNVLISSLAGHPNNGFIGVADENGNAKAGMYVNENGQGQIFADTKNFVADDPQHFGGKIVYTSLEGPEAAVYARGVVHLRHGRGTIRLPEHFLTLANLDTMTVQLTPASLHSRGVGFERLRGDGIAIGELNGGSGWYDVHFVVTAVRRGYEQQSPTLSADEFRARFGAVRSNTDLARLGR